MHILVTAGPTREFIDPVRFLSNRSTGKMGYAIAEAAIRAGHSVTLISGPSSLQPPKNLHAFCPVVSALEMLEAVENYLPSADALVMAAAVADFRPARRFDRKCHKNELGSTLELVPNPDILATIRPLKENRFFVGFAAETTDVQNSAAGKLHRKGLDLIVANDVTQPGAGFETDTNIVTLLAPNADAETLPLLSKAETAQRIIARMEAEMQKRRQNR
ncbi:MAG: phosphopantothenoylcysteine decarboxylase [Kiritimatiellia bacterium]